jgi:sugar phosphate isomerase/epimerase
MRVGLFTDGLSVRQFDDVLDWLATELPEIACIELGTGGYSPAPHCQLDDLLARVSARHELSTKLSAHGLELVALNVSGNPLQDPNHDRALRETIRLAPLLGVDRIVCMSGGLPELEGGVWFPALEEGLTKYWEDRVLPYWAEISELAAKESEGLRLCFELEPGAAVFNVSTFERVMTLGGNLAVNIDPSHFFWQSIDPLAAIKRLGERVGYAHGKDTLIDIKRIGLDGVLDRSTWRYATVGTGHDTAWWQAFIRELQTSGYEGPISIEFEDPLELPEESIASAARFLMTAAGKSMAP